MPCTQITGFWDAITRRWRLSAHTFAPSVQNTDLNHSTMKKHIFSTLIVVTALSISTNAQTTNVWKGGFPGHENDWHYYKNWSLGKTPDTFDNVVIPETLTTTRRYPVIASGEVEVGGLLIQPGASLVLLSEARLLADDIQIMGTCKGCERRILIEGTVENTAYSPKH